MNGLNNIMRNRNLTFYDLYLKINKEIPLHKLSKIRNGLECITLEEIKILDKYLKLSEEEIEMLDRDELNYYLIEGYQKMAKIFESVPPNLKAGQSIETECHCGGILTISRARINGHLWIICSKEGVLFRE